MKEVEIKKSSSDKIIEYLKSSKTKLINRELAFRITKLTRASTLLSQMCNEGLLDRVKVGVYSLRLDNQIMPKQKYTKQKSAFKRESDKKNNSIKEQVNHPSHYGGKNNVYEAIKVINAWGLNFELGNTVKYISIAGKKDPNKMIEDLKKALFYLNYEINKLENK